MIKTYKAGKRYLELKEELHFCRKKAESLNFIIVNSIPDHLNREIFVELEWCNTLINSIEEELLK